MLYLEACIKICALLITKIFFFVRVPNSPPFPFPPGKV